MINIEIINNKTIKVNGHANYAEYGSDIVCASVSTAVYMSVNQIEVFDKSHCIKTTIKEGNACIKVVCEDEIVKKVIKRGGCVNNLIKKRHNLNLIYNYITIASTVKTPSKTSFSLYTSNITVNIPDSWNAILAT